MKEQDDEYTNNEQTPEMPESNEEITPVSNEEPLETAEQSNPVPPGKGIYSLDPTTFENIKRHQNLVYALVGGLLVAIICAFLWAGITIGTKRQIGFMAIGVGLAVGFSVRFFGAGVTQKFGILGALLSLFGCMLGNLLSQVGFIAQEYHHGYFETFSYLDFSSIISIMTESFSPMDILFYGFAIFEGYKFSFRPITDEVIEDNGDSSHFKYRMPLVIVGVIILSLVYIKVKMGVNGDKSYFYPSGNVMSKGSLKNSKENGEWNFYNENGTLQATGSFDKGIRDGVWNWYYEDGKLSSTGSYKNGMENGLWISYYSSGSIGDSVSYENGRPEGNYIYRFENGNLYQKGQYHLSLKEGIWETYFENGQLQLKQNYKNDEPFGESFQYFEDGKPFEEMNYLSENNVLTKNLWNKSGKQLVTDGNGHYETYFDNGNISVSGEVINGEKTGIWELFFENGNKKEELNYQNNTPKYVNAWDEEGNQTVTDGDGTYTIYMDNVLIQKGDVKHGEKTGIWTAYYQDGKSILQEIEYVNGKENGMLKSYFQSGEVEAEGKMVNGSREGEWKWYHENGKLSSSVNLKNDKKEGKQLFYNENGDKVREETYKDGELIETK